MSKRTWDEDGGAEEAEKLGIWPLDAHNTALLNDVHPREWQNPTPLQEYDLVVIGAGAGGSGQPGIHHM